MSTSSSLWCSHSTPSAYEPLQTTRVRMCPVPMAESSVNAKCQSVAHVNAPTMMEPLETPPSWVLLALLFYQCLPLWKNLI